MANRSPSTWIIKHRLWLILLGIASSSISWAQRLSYTIQTDQHQHKALRVTLTYLTGNTTSTLFRYANNYWGETGLGACLLEVKANASLQRKTVGDWVVLTVNHRPRQRIRLTYLIRPDQTAPYAMSAPSDPSSNQTISTSMALGYLCCQCLIRLQLASSLR